MEGEVSDWRSIKDDREKYAAYLCSREWALLRNAVRDRCDGICERCDTNEMQCVHHLTYARKYNERLEDLAGWCNACHDFTHGRTNEDPVETRESELFVDAVVALRKDGVSWAELKGRLLSGRREILLPSAWDLLQSVDIPGLAKDILETAPGASWRGDVLVVSMAAGAGASYLMRSEVRALVRDALSEKAGKRVDYIVEPIQ